MAYASAGRERWRSAGRSSSRPEIYHRLPPAGRSTSRQALPDLGGRRGTDWGRGRGSGSPSASFRVRQPV